MGSASVEQKFKKFFWNRVGGILPDGQKSSSSKIQSVLVLRPDRLGDFVLSIPALAELQRQMGKAGRLTLLAGDRNAQLARFYFPEAKIWVSRKNIFSRVSLWFRLWFNSFDAVIDLHSYPFSTTTTLLSVFSGAPIRVGFWAVGDFQEYSSVSKRVFNQGTKAPAENLPEVQKSFLLIKRLFPKAKLDLSKGNLPSVSKKIEAAVESFYTKADIKTQDKVLGIHPTLQKQDNRWSQEKYLELIKGLTSVKGLKIVVVHGKGEMDELERFQRLTAGFSNVFTLPSDDLFFILEAAKRFDGMVCNDSGIMHVCAWVTPLFAVFGPSNAKRWGPQNQKRIKHHIFQTKDGLCDSVKPKQVVQVIRRELF